MNADRLRITVLGCGSSTGVPRVGNIWGNCDPDNPKNRRLRSSLLVEKLGSDGITRVLIDTGPDLRAQLLSANIQHLDGVLYTHGHADHMHGIDDLRGLFILNRRRVPIYCDAPTLARIREGFEYCIDAPEGGFYPPILEHRLITAEQRFEVNGQGGPLAVWPVLHHHGPIDSLGFRFGSFLYSPDISAMPAASEWHFESVKTWMLDALRLTPHPSHYSLEESLAAAESRSIAEVYLTHMHSDLDYETVNSDTPAHVQPCYDGLVIEIEYTHS